MTKRNSQSMGEEKYSIDWPPGFVSQIRVDARTKKYETDYARAQRTRLAGGWDSHPVGLGGSYISDRPEMMGVKK